MNSGFKGFSLIEMMVTLGILSIVVAGSAVLIINNFQTQQRTQQKFNLSQTALQFSKLRGPAAARQCTQVVKFAQNFAGAGAKTDISMNPDGTIAYQAGSIVPGTSPFTVTKLYLDDVSPVTSIGTGGYVGTIYLTGQVNGTSAGTTMTTAPQAIATISMVVTNNQLESCNILGRALDSQGTCSNLYGMIWNGSSTNANCDQEVVVSPNGQLTCPPGMYSQNNFCVLDASSCGNGELAKGFNFGQPVGCRQPPLNPAVGVGSTPTSPPIVVTGPVMNLKPSSVIPVHGTFIPPVTSQLNGGHSQQLPSSCTNPKTVGSVNLNYCNQTNGCNQNGLQPDTGCTSLSSVNYQAPSGPPPSPAPPNDGSCACSNYRIAQGESCMYCLNNVNLGFGFVRYAYGVSQCTNGKLVPQGSAQLDTTGYCGDTYLPAYKNPKTGRYSQVQ